MGEAQSSADNAPRAFLNKFIWVFIPVPLRSGELVLSEGWQGEAARASLGWGVQQEHCWLRNKHLVPPCRGISALLLIPWPCVCARG